MKNKINFSSIKVKLSIVLICLSLIPLIIVGVLSYHVVGKIIYSNLQTSTNQNLQEIEKEILTYFSGMENYLNMISQNTYVKQLNQYPEYNTYVSEMLKTVNSSNKDILNIYFAQSNKTFNVYPLQKVPEGFDATSRDWYKNASNERERLIYTNPYKDTGTGKLVISISKAVENNGQVVGVIGMDISIDELFQKFSNITIGQWGHICIVDSNGIIISNKDKNTIGKNISDVVNIWTEIKNGKSGFKEYEFKGNKRYVSYVSSSNMSWKIMGMLQEKELIKSTSIIKRLTFIMIIFMGIVSLFISYRITQFLIKKFNELNLQFSKAAKGDLSVTVDFKSKDELEELGNYFNSMIFGIKRFVQSLRSSSDNIVKSSYTIDKMSGETNKAIKEIACTIEDMSKGAVNQEHHISESYNMMEDLADKIENMEKLIEEIIKGSIESNELGIKGLRSMETMYDKTSKGSEAVNHVSQIVMDMNSAVSEIGLITNTINDISEQTNLLALNAAIESSRAGEAGRSFAVVSDAIRQLSEESGDAAKRIQALIEQVEKKSHRAVKSIGETKLISEEQSSSVDNTKYIFNSIVDAMKKVLNEMNLVRDSIKNMDRNKEDLLSTMENISSISQQYSASTQEIAASSGEITLSLNKFTDVAGNLKEISCKFENEMNRFNISSDS